MDKTHLRPMVVRQLRTSSLKAKLRTNAGLNIFELMLLVVLAGVMFGVALAVGRQFGLWWGLLATPVTLAAAIALYSVFYWLVGFLPYPLGAPRHRKPPATQGESDTNNVAYAHTGNNTEPMTSSPRLMRFAHVAHILGIVASLTFAGYLVFIGYTLHRQTTVPGCSLWHWSDAIGIMLIGIAGLHLCGWRLFRAIRAWRISHAQLPSDTRDA